MNILNRMPVLLINLMVQRGLMFSIQKDYTTNEAYLDMNTGMKSHAHLYYTNGEFKMRMRYGEEHKIETLGCVVYAVKSCLHGRDFMNSAWGEILDEHGLGEDDNALIDAVDSISSISSIAYDFNKEV